MLNPDLRARMGKAGQKRAETLFDWAAVVPQMQDLFAELGAIRAAADPKRFPPTPASLLPTGPSPMASFASFPTEQIKRAGPERYVMRPIPNPLPVRDTWSLRNYAPTRRIFEPLADIEKVAAAVEAAASAGAASTTIAEATGISVLRVERCLLWLLKYDYVERGAG
jgi:hypothetical protein